MGRAERQLGDKIGPRLVDLMVQGTLAARRGLAPHEARVRQAATQALIDRAGAEIADLYRPMLRDLLADPDAQLHPHVRDYLAKAAAGTHQYHSIGGLLFGLSQSALSGAISNAVAPIAYAINALGPNLALDPQTSAQAAAAGIVGGSDAFYSGRRQGYGPGEMQVLLDLAAQVPDPGTLGQLVNRGLISEADAERWLHRGMIPPDLRAHLVAMRRQLLTGADLALATLRGEMPESEAAARAARTGLDAADFAVLVANTGEPLGLEQLQEALRRGIITAERFDQGVRQSRVRNEWIPTALALRYQPMSLADAADAALRGHLTEDAARQIALLNGLRPGDWPAYWANQGSPPAPEQLLALWRRGFITEQQVDTGLRQGRLRDSWIPAVKDLKTERLPTADALDAWLRGHLTRDQAADIATENGLAAEDLPAAFGNAGNPLGLEQLLEALRRGFIDSDTFIRGFRESRYRDEWAPTALKLGYQPMSTADAVEASIQGWLTRDQAREVAHLNGLEPRYFDPLWQTAGEPLSRTELEQLYNRGLVSREAVRQGLRESRLKDKYIDDALALHVRLPQPREVVLALTEGVVSREAATRLLGDMGYQPEVVAMLIATGEVRSTGPHRQLMTGEISKLYADRIIDHAAAARLLAQLHYTSESADLILRVADYTLQRKILDSGLAAIKSHYLSRRIGDAAAAGDLHALGLPGEAVTTYMRVWRLDRLEHPRQLSEAQIVKAARLGLFVERGTLTAQKWEEENRAAGHARLVALGYDDSDAGLLLAGA